MSQIYAGMAAPEVHSGRLSAIWTASAEAPKAKPALAWRGGVMVRALDVHRAADPLAACQGMLTGSPDPESCRYLFCRPANDDQPRRTGQGIATTDLLKAWLGQSPR